MMVLLRFLSRGVNAAHPIYLHTIVTSKPCPADAYVLLVCGAVTGCHPFILSAGLMSITEHFAEPSMIFLHSYACNCFLLISTREPVAAKPVLIRPDLLNIRPGFHVCFILNNIQDPVDASPAVLVKRYDITQQKELEIQLAARQGVLLRYFS